MPSIAIIGTEACGKTVFVTTLAKRLTMPGNQGVFIEPLSPCRKAGRDGMDMGADIEKVGVRAK